jgi:hypothetical protein
MEVDHLTLFLAAKSLPSQPVWREPKPDFLSLTSPLDIEGITVEGLRFRATARRSLLSESITFQLEFHDTKGQGGPMCRIEWKPLSGHNNKGHGPPEYRNRLITGSHVHPFELNWALGAKFVRRGNLPVAIPVDTDLPNFREALAYTTRVFNIGNLWLVATPAWEVPLL